MKKILIFMFVAYLAQACKKEVNQNPSASTNTAISMEIDGKALDMVYEPDESNRCSVYSFGGVLGQYFNLITDFTLKDKSEIQVSFGTALSPYPKLSDSIFLSMIRPGSKTYGSLGAFSSFPLLKPDCVEIAFTDEKSRRWCTSQITEKITANGVEARVEVHQSQSQFVIEKIEKVQTSQGRDGYQLTGKFDCFLFEVNGHAKKKLKGKIVGLVYNNG